MTENDKMEKRTDLIVSFLQHRRLFLLKQKFKTLDKIAEIMNISSSYISHILSERRNTLWIRFALAVLADVDYSDFWGSEPPKLDRAAMKKLKNVEYRSRAENE